MSVAFMHAHLDRTFFVEGVPGLNEGLIRRALTSKLFADWIGRVEPRFVLRRILFQSIDVFSSDRLGFCKIDAEAYERLEDGTVGDRSIPGIILLRGDSVAILVVLICGNARYALMVRQSRLAAGAFSFLEMAAGMVEGDTILSAALREMEEELGPDFRLTAKDLKVLRPRMYLSAGACDERIQLYLHERHVTRADLGRYRGMVTGCLKERERITLDVVPLKQLLRTQNATSIVAYHEYQALLGRRRRAMRAA